MDKDETGDHEERANHSPAVSNSLGDDTIDEETDNLCNSSSVAEGVLPLDLDLICLYTVDDACRLAVLLGKGGHGVEVTQEPGIVTLHDDGEGETEGEEDGERVELDALAEAHLPLGLSSSTGIGGQLGQVGDGDGHLAEGLIFLVQDVAGLRAARDGASRDDRRAAATTIKGTGSSYVGLVVGDAHVAATRASRAAIFGVVEAHAGEMSSMVLSSEEGIEETV